MQPGVEYMYEMEAAAGLVQRPDDGEVDGFSSGTWTKSKWEWLEAHPSRATCSSCWTSSFGTGLDTTNEPDYAEINCRLHRTLEFLPQVTRN